VETPPIVHGAAAHIHPVKSLNFHRDDGLDFQTRMVAADRADAPRGRLMA
jgi:hypothetical protein